MKTKLSILTAALICAFTLTSCSEQEELSPPVLNTAAEASCILGETEDMGSGYIDSFVFFGESTTYHLKSRGVLSGGSSTKQVLGNSSGTAMLNSETSNIGVICPHTGETVSISEAVRRLKPEYMLLSFGLNGAVRNVKGGKELFKSNYKKLTDTILSASPDTKIIIASGYPIAKSMDTSAYNISPKELNSHIDTLNRWATEFTEDEGFRYLNVREALTDSEGYLREDLQTGDGHHMTRDAYIIILNYIRTHGYR
ncbi:MAG: hypothetical protein E7607_04380 [Ruminococcaceae bacterium]|nr:hypothetical protein [Oscillospiraceae bacterium]